MKKLRLPNLSKLKSYLYKVNINTYQYTVGILCVVLLVSLWGIPKYIVYNKRLNLEFKVQAIQTECELLKQVSKVEHEATMLKAEAIERLGVAVQKFPNREVPEILVSSFTGHFQSKDSPYLTEGEQISEVRHTYNEPLKVSE